jgi:hypothetical protein
VIVIGDLLLVDARAVSSWEMRAELLAKDLPAFGSHRDGAGAIDPAHPALVETADA